MSVLISNGLKYDDRVPLWLKIPDGMGGTAEIVNRITLERWGWDEYEASVTAGEIDDLGTLVGDVPAAFADVYPWAVAVAAQPAAPAAQQGGAPPAQQQNQPPAQQQNPPPPPAQAAVTAAAATGTGTATASVTLSGGPAPAAATATVTVAFDTGGPVTGSPFSVPIAQGDTAAAAAGKVRQALGAVAGIDAAGTGATVTVTGTAAGTYDGANVQTLTVAIA